MKTFKFDDSSKNQDPIIVRPPKNLPPSRAVCLRYQDKIRVATYLLSDDDLNTDPTKGASAETHEN